MKIVKAECIDPANLIFRFHGGAGQRAFDYASGMLEWVPVPATFNNMDHLFQLQYTPCGDVLVLVEV